MAEKLYIISNKLTGSVTILAPALEASVMNLTALAMFSGLDAPTAIWIIASLNSTKLKMVGQYRAESKIRDGHRERKKILKSRYKATIVGGENRIFSP